MALRIISRAMPRNTRPLDDEIFLAGLLHDIGYMVLNQLDPKRSDELQNRFIAEPTRSCTEIETEMIELNHCELGAELGSYWDLPESIIAVMRYHHTPDEELAAVGQPLVSMVSIAEKVLSGFGIPEQSAGAVSAEDWKSLGIDPALADELIEQIKQQAEEAKKSPTSFS
jgi:putative nucleotidyltransferase with HDIG domain